MIDETARTTPTASAQPERSDDAVVDGNPANPGETANPSGVETSFVAAFSVKREHDGSVSLSTPLVGGGTFNFVTANPVPDLERFVRLPVKDLANPGVALVVRSSLERLVKAARLIVSPEFFGTDPFESRIDLDAALEPFKDVAP